MDMRRLLGLNFVWEFARGFVLDLSWTCLATVMIAPNAEVGKSVATSFAQLLAYRGWRPRCLFGPFDGSRASGRSNACRIAQMRAANRAASKYRAPNIIAQITETLINS
jgi:hypothetical protein